MKYKQKFKEDAIRKINSSDITIKDQNLIISKLTAKEKPKRSTWSTLSLVITSVVLTSLVVLIAIPALIFILLSVRTVSSFRNLPRNYNINEVSDTFIPLNEVNYPSIEKKSISVSKEYTDSVNTFANNIYQNIPYEETNFSFSPLGLYANLSILSLASTDETVMNQFDNLLLLDEPTRKNQFRNFYQNDYYANELGTMQLYNGLFQSPLFGTINSDFIALLADYYCEAFSLDFTKEIDVQKMVDWANQRVGKEDFLSPQDLEIDSDSVLYLLTTLNFDNHWSVKFSDDESYDDLFYVTPTQSIETRYMTHAYYGNYYDYGCYYSFYDSYANNMKIKYLISKNAQDNIFDLTDSIDIFVDNEALLHADEVIKNSVPIFSSSSLVDFSLPLTNLGYGDFFSPSVNSFGNIYTDFPEAIYLGNCKQKNQICFSEDGTTLTSVTWSGLRAGTGAPMEGGIEVQLNQPFIYIIYDENDLPIYVGNVTNPRL